VVLLGDMVTDSRAGGSGSGRRVSLRRRSPSRQEKRLSARLVVLASGTGGSLQALLDAGTDAAYGARVVAVGADRAGTGALERATGAGLPTFVVRLEDFAERADWEAALGSQLAAHEPDLVVLAGFMKLLGQAVLSRFPDRVINTHPALLPAFPGAHAVRDALAYGVKISGATVHVVDAGLDSGPVVAQCAVEVAPGEDEPALLRRIQAVERPLLVEAVRRLAAGYRLEGRRVVLS